MPDDLIDDPIRTAFTELRATEQPQVVPPGANAARRTLRGRRRRRFAVTGAAALVAVVLLGAGVLAGTAQDPLIQRAGADGPPETASATDPPSPHAPPFRWDSKWWDREERIRLYEITQAALGRELASITEVGRPSATPREPGWSVRSERGVKPPGTYLLRVACAGTEGTVTVTVRVGSNEATASAQCGNTVEEVRAGVGEETLVIGEDNTTMAGASWGGEGPHMVGITLVRQ